MQASASVQACWRRIAFLLCVVLIAVALLYAVFRRAGERWWLWGTAACSVLLALMLLVTPVLIDPLFNT